MVQPQPTLSIETHTHLLGPPMQHQSCLGIKKYLGLAVYS